MDDGLFRKSTTGYLLPAVCCMIIDTAMISEEGKFVEA